MASFSASLSIMSTVSRLYSAYFSVSKSLSIPICS